MSACKCICHGGGGGSGMCLLTVDVKKHLYVFFLSIFFNFSRFFVGRLSKRRVFPPPHAEQCGSAIDNNLCH